MKAARSNRKPPPAAEPVPDIDIITWAKRLPFGRDARLIETLLMVRNAVEASDLKALRAYVSLGRGGQVGTRISHAAMAIVEGADTRSDYGALERALRGPDLALECLFQRSDEYKRSLREWLTVQQVSKETSLSRDDSKPLTISRLREVEPVAVTDALDKISRLSGELEEYDGDDERLAR